MPGTRKLGKATDHRIAMLKNLTTALLENGKIETTVAKAKEVRSLAERMITLGKQNGRRFLILRKRTLLQSCLAK